MNIAVRYNDPDAPTTGAETVEFTFWFSLDGTRSVDEVGEEVLAVLERACIRGVQPAFRSPYAKLYQR